MGLEAVCTATFGHEHGEGHARLETAELRFRGPFRLKIPFVAIRRAEAARGVLTVTFSGGVATFDLGKAAETWALKIRCPKPLIDKIGVKPRMRVALVGAYEGARDQAFWDALGHRATIRAGRSTRAKVEMVLCFAGTAAELDRLAALRDRIVDAGSIWVVYPKGVKVIREIEVIAAGKRHGLVDVKIASFSESHSAMKLVIPVGKRSSRAPAE